MSKLPQFKVVCWARTKGGSKKLIRTWEDIEKFRLYSLLKTNYDRTCAIFNYIKRKLLF